MRGSLLIAGLAGPEPTPEETALITRLQPAGFILLSRNFTTPAQTRHLTDTLRRLCHHHPLLAVDLTGAPGAGLGPLAPPMPPPADLAALGVPKTVGTAGMLTGERLRLLGFNFAFGPILEPDRPPASGQPAAPNRWGSDPQRVIDHAGQWNRWLRQRGIASCAGSFPAGDSSPVTADRDLPTCPASFDELLRGALLPFTALMPELDAIQSGHCEFPNIDPDWPASFSPRVIRRCLRDQLGFDRQVVISAALDHGSVSRRFGLGQAARLTIEAGHDLALISGSIATAPEAAAAIAALPGPTLAEAWERVENLRDRLHWPSRWSDAAWEENLAKQNRVPGLMPGTR